jgi:hypothetical protein
MRRDLRDLLKWCLVVVLLYFAAVKVKQLSDKAALPFDDFLAFWSAARLELQGKNPYSLDALLTEQETAGWDQNTPFVVWYPPWVFPLILPFGVFSYPMGRILWLLCQLSVILVSASILWRSYQGSPRFIWVAWVLALSFAPSLFVLRNGQITPFLLLGVAAFAYFEGREKKFASGLISLLIAVKPQLSYLFWLVWVLWVFQRRCWAALTGATLSLLTATLIALYFNPSVISDWIGVWSTTPPLYWATPTLGTLMRLSFGPEFHWLQFFPSLLMLISLGLVVSLKKLRWNWDNYLPLLLMASMATASYGWVADTVLLLPALIDGAIRVWRLRSLHEKLLFAFIYALANFFLFLMNLWKFSGTSYVWVTPLFLVIYLAAWKRSSSSLRGSGRLNEVALD